MTVVHTNNTDGVWYIRKDDAQMQIKAAKLAILRELLRTGPGNYLLHAGNRPLIQQLSGRNMQNAVWRDHIAARIKQLEQSK